jgi:hypothetical protein
VIVQYDPANPLSDFRNFLAMVWKHLGLKPPTKRQLEIAYFLQYEDNPRKMVEAFRGIGKSWITDAFILFLLYNRPEMNILVVSASGQKAAEKTTFCKRLIDEMPELRHMRPREGQRDSTIAFDVAAAPPAEAPSLRSVGITGQITGSRADLIVPDDIETPENASTTMMREKLAEKIKEFDAVLKPDGHVIYLGTPQTQDSVYNRLPERGYTIRIWPAHYPDEKQQAKYSGKLEPGILADLKKNPGLVGHSTEPTRFSDDDLYARQLSYGKAGFSLQFMLDTDLSDLDRFPLKLKDLVVMPLMDSMAPEKVIWSALPDYALNDLPIVGMRGDRYYRAVAMPGIMWQPYAAKVLAIDPSGRGKDETGWAVVGMCNGLLFLLDAGGFAEGFSDTTLTGLALLAKKWQVQATRIEANFGDGMFTKLLTPVMAKHWPNHIEEVKHSIQKERRILDTLEPVLGSHRLVVNQALIQQDFDSVRERLVEDPRRYQLFYQMTHITRDRGSLANDDRLDALSIGVAHFTEAMAQDVDKKVAEERERQMQKELEKYKRQVFGPARPKARGWVRR